MIKRRKSFFLEYGNIFAEERVDNNELFISFTATDPNGWDTACPCCTFYMSLKQSASIASSDKDCNER